MQVSHAIARPNLAAISQREKQVLQLITDEYTSMEIADLLHISTETVHSHRKNVMMKLEARNTAGLVRRALEYGVIQLSIIKINIR